MRVVVNGLQWIGSVSIAISVIGFIATYILQSRAAGAFSMVTLFNSFTAYFLVTLVEGLSSTTWPEVSGIVTKTWIDKHHREADVGGDKYEPCVLYRYEVGEKMYQNSCIGFYNYEERSSGLAEIFLRRYPVDTLLSVRVAPWDPARAVLEPGVPFRVFLQFLCSAMLLAFFIVSWTKLTFDS